jgi:hypothetical protein
MNGKGVSDMTMKNEQLNAFQIAAIAKVLQADHVGIFQGDLDRLRKLFNSATAVTVRYVERTPAAEADDVAKTWTVEYA